MKQVINQPVWNLPGLPSVQGLYHPGNEHDGCGIGFVAHIKGQKSHDIIEKGLEVNKKSHSSGSTRM
ncbi:MAG: hypothetical protein R3B95_02120 [Nitrospirales bacterium]